MSIINPDGHPVNPTPADAILETGLEPAWSVSPLCQCQEVGRVCDYCHDESFAAWKVERAVAELKAAAEADTLPEEPDADDLAELTEWAAEQDARDFLDRSATLGLAKLVEHQAAFYRAWPTEAGALIAETVDDLAAKVLATDARTPNEYRARIGVLDDEARDQWQEVGYQEGLAAGREECRRKHGRTPGMGRLTD
jgi:hypothetical protein